MKRLVNMRLDEDLLKRVDALAGSRGRTAFVERALESMLGASDVANRPGPPGGDGATESRPLAVPKDAPGRSQGDLGTSVPASTRAPVDLPEDAHGQFSKATAVRLSCPVPGCDFSAKSPKAVCGKHSRMVR